MQQIIALLRETSFPKYLAYQYALLESYRWKKQIDFASLTPSLICNFLSVLKTYKCLFNYKSAGKVFLYTYIQQRKTKRTFFGLFSNALISSRCLHVFFTFYHHYPHYHENKNLYNLMILRSNESIAKNYKKILSISFPFLFLIFALQICFKHVYTTILIYVLYRMLYVI